MTDIAKSDGSKKVVVAMSGGVDSSVSAALLQKVGWDVVGVFMKCWSEEEVRTGVCTAIEDEYEARKVAGRLGIPLYTFDLVKEYKERVADYFVSEYAKGRTPNPDVMCNKEIKFGIFFEKAVGELGADYVATGHYARVARKACNSRVFSIFNFQFSNKFQNSNSKSQIAHKLLEGSDKNKDQSYFLYRLQQKHLAKTLFPVGEYEKSQVRELARAFGLPNAERKDSQGLCFIGKVKVQDFLHNYIPDSPGPIVNHLGITVGQHNGLHLYTIGQRKGIGAGGGPPYYVTDKERATNTLRVAFEYDEALQANECMVEDIHWIQGSAPEFPLHCDVRIRYRQPRQRARIMNYESGIMGEGDSIVPHPRFRIQFEAPQRAITSGQSAVFYQGEECLGGGIIC